MTNTPKLQTGEQLILQGQGAHKDNFRSGWKAAQCFLTNQRFMIYQRPTIRFEIPVGDIKDLVVEKVHYVIRKRESLCLSYEARTGSRHGRIWFVANDLENWRKRIYQASLLKVDLETIDSLAAQLDPESRDILCYLWENRHARIDHLADLIDAPSHMHVLLKIRETINPIADKVIGCPLLSFERSRVDAETGEAVLFSWWMMGQQKRWIQSEDRLLDIFDEGSHLQVIMEVRGIEASDLRLEVHGKELTVKSEKDGFGWKEIIHLPADVNTDNYQLHIKNNLLEIKLHRTGSKNLQRANCEPAKGWTKPEEIVSMRNERNGMDSRNSP